MRKRGRYGETVPGASRAAGARRLIASETANRAAAHIPAVHPAVCIAMGLLMAVAPGSKSSAQDATSTAVVMPQTDRTAPDLKFERFTRRDGLPTVPIGSIIQNDDGMLWLTSWNGLYRFDGLTFKGYFHDPADSTSVSADWVTGQLLDSAGRFWIGTIGGGLNRFDRDSEQFIHYRHDPDDPQSLSGDAIGVLVESADGSIWVATDRGLDRLDPETGRFRRYEWDPDDPTTLAGNQVRAIHEENSETVWVGTGNPFVGGEPGALNRLDPRTGRVERYFLDPSDPMSSRNFVETILPDPAGFFWVTTWEGGLYRFDPGTGTYSNVIVPLAPYATEDVYFGITSIKRGADRNVLWMSVFRGGVLRFDTRTSEVTQYGVDPDDPFSLPDPRVWHVTLDAENTLWVATHTGLARADLAGRLDRIDLPPGAESDWVSDIGVLDERTVIIGTSGDRIVTWDGRTPRRFNLPDAECRNFNITGAAVTASATGDVFALGRCGMFRFDPESGRFRRIPMAVDSEAIAGDHPMRIREDDHGWIWIASEPAVLRFDPRSGAVEWYGDRPDPSRRLTHDDMEFLSRDSNGHIWIGAADGLNRVDWSGGTPNVIRYGFEDSYQTPGVTGLDEADDGSLWISTDQLGLVHMDRDGSILGSVTVQDGLNVSSYLDVAMASNGSIWGRSVNGLSVFDPIGGGVENFSAADGLVPAQFGVHAIARAQNGRILVGGEGAFNVIDPDERLPSFVAPATIFTELRINGEIQRATEEGVLSRRLSRTSEISLPFDENDVQVAWTSPAFRSPELINYQVRLEPVDADWFSNGSSRTIRYTNLDPGSYTLRVRARTGLGNWNEEPTTLSISIRRPWWGSVWAYLIYAALFAGATREIVRRLRLRAVREEKERARLQELEQARALREAYDELEATHRQLKETQARVSELKSRFFANISHEFRTPLTLILGQIESMMSARKAPGPADAELDRLESMQRNGKRLLRLINQLLDLSRMEAGAMRLVARQADLVSFVAELSESFESVARMRGIHWSFEADRDECQIIFDADKLEKVFFNLFSNALKFTPPGGSVRIRLGARALAGGAGVAVDVIDTGPGIPDEQQDRIFDRFFQAASGHRTRGEGTGIGLALTKELVELHHGSITIESEQGCGSTFSVLLSADPSTFAAQELAESGDGARTRPMYSSPEPDELLFEHGQIGAANEERSTMRPESGAESAEEDEQIILVVEDNDELRRFIAAELAGRYRVEQAATGMDGLKRAFDLVPDLIVSDVMMPEMDGFEMLRELRADERTSHIPVVMLTARAADEDLMEGISRGADAYVVKPFSRDELRLRVAKLIEMRRLLRERFRTATVIRPGEVEAADIDQEFLARVLGVIEERISEADFTIEDLGAEVGMSVSQLNRKLNALVDQSAGKLVASMRLQRAADLLAQNAGSVSEIADRVGYSSQSSLTTAFKRRFGITPSAYRDTPVAGNNNGV